MVAKYRIQGQAVIVQVPLIDSLTLDPLCLEMLRDGLPGQETNLVDSLLGKVMVGLDPRDSKLHWWVQ